MSPRLLSTLVIDSMHGFRKFGQRGANIFCNFVNFVLVLRGEKKLIPLSASHHRHSSETPSPNIECWRAIDGPTLNAGLAALRFFRGFLHENNFKGH